MKENWNDNDFNGHKRRKKSKRHDLHRATLLLCCCLTVIAVAIGLIAYDIPSVVDKQPDTHLSTSAVNNIDSSTTSTANAQSSDDETTWCLILVNKWNHIPYNYEVDLTELGNGQSVDTRIYPALQEMLDTARSDNVYPIAVSGYRTAEKQQSLMSEKIADYKAEGYSDAIAITKAEAWVAVPGTSEHQLGIAVDINADGIHSTGNEVYEWLNQNSYKFGFIHRYPDDKTEITGVIDEPWHYRYVGVDAATEIYNQGVCLEEYLNKID